MVHDTVEVAQVNDPVSVRARHKPERRCGPRGAKGGARANNGVKMYAA